VGDLRDSTSGIEGGEIGSGYSMMAIFEVIPTELNKGAIKDHYTSGKFASMKLTYADPNDPKNISTFTQVSHFEYVPFEEMDNTYRFSAAVALFGGILRNSPFVKQAGWNEVLSIAEASSNSDDLLQKEFIALVEQAKALYTKVKKKK
jgi:Ca-activated chloride channel family protein